MTAPSRLGATALGVVLSGAALVGAPSAAAQTDTCADIRTGEPLSVAVGPCADVLAQERRWLTAITAGDVATVEQILGPTFTHITSDGQILDRAAEIRNTAPEGLTMNPGGQQVRIDGGTAVIHGVNTIVAHDAVVATERFTDVFVLQNGAWRAVSAQETTI
ncbi:hypothetical protein A5757_20120 [Mycobacterium sp. 852013-51886_SCH5428379]|uniref:nuclear transport factor 2 family protein n=1 Tax=Mycobacterium sp. 852013-51886_SCH5428379 TaxID=1834111 RepID=UPI000801BE9A|nr:nuclear transport factor 2 family protein [Mycobacterium sp. 852013-51886_SCH5428379]OBB57478.1 hypothetical protein A5757_20120 [Mycobacterium sp. 852013-51886_SCH5428379]